MSPPSEPTTPARVSVVVPAYNYGRFLEPCVTSVLRQHGVVVDVVVVDDASTDDTAARAAAMAEADPRVRLIHHEHNRGHIDTFNEGLFAVDGDYTVLLDADDLLPPGSLARATALFEAHPEVGLVSGWPRPFTERPPDGGPADPRSWTIWPGHEWVADRCRRGYNTIATPEVVMRTSVMRETGGMKRDLPHTGDFELWMQIAARSDVGRVNGPPQGYYRIHPDSMQRTVYAGAIIDLEGRRDAFRRLFEGPAGSWPDAAGLHADARRALAGQALDRACRAFDRGHTDEVPVAALTAFALEVWPDAEHLAGWRSLERRRRMGPRLARVAPPFVARALTRRAGEELGRLRWERTGIR